ncbi:hypothetical protein DESHY_10001 [Desulforamulus hydrothermalis Lam5 = DSM 18033]|uniref:Uncharacterized protein n=1 Tax=Desulforamulus hydrothermalis Lam5 = DSM 18033 TaxID=1121428 RepID=K8EDD2_9FIRM|nr:hypothetical protein DESHY_10001 [Desulforamulus hydrothermalis Lam5 = DSM 18033]
MDNAKQMVITHQGDGIVRYNDDFLKFCGLYDIPPPLTSRRVAISPGAGRVHGRSILALLKFSKPVKKHLFFAQPPNTPFLIFEF